MSTGSGIEWTEATWNPVVGCTPVSPGCLNCYAATMARRLEGMGMPEYLPRPIAELPPINLAGVHRLEGVWCRCGGEVWYEDCWKAGKASKEWRWEAYCRKCKACDCNGYSSLAALKKESPAFWGDHSTIRIAEVRSGRAVFTGEVRCLEDRLTIPLGWKRPRMIFVNSMSDLFHEDVPFEFIDRVFAVMALCPQHTFQVLTKRAGRMAEYMLHSGGKVNGKSLEREGHIGLEALAITFEAQSVGLKHVGTGVKLHRDGELLKWPLPNVWIGVSAEDQKRLDERVPDLLACPAAVRFLSCEPLLGALDLSCVMNPRREIMGLGGPYMPDVDAGVQWVIVGGESGHNARPCDLAWVRSIVEQCMAAGVPVFVKQLGARPVQYAWIAGANSLVLLKNRKG